MAKRRRVWVLCSVLPNCQCDVLAVYADQTQRMLAEHRRSDARGAASPLAACNCVLKECELYL